MLRLRILKIIFLTCVACFLFTASLYHLCNTRSIAYRSSKLENDSPYSNSSFTYTTNKLVMDMYEEGHLIENTNLCPALGKNIKLMILVISAPDHNKARMAIRQTWGSYSRHDIGIGFIVGSYKQPSKNAIIQMEQNKYGDLIQTRIMDSYKNLTLKIVSTLAWVDSYCSQVPFVLKTDDDMFINMPLLLALLEKLQLAKRSIFGRLAHKWKPYPVVKAKIFLSKSEYKLDLFPDFVTGPSYLMTQDSVHDLYHQARKMPFLKLEDVFITGLVANRCGIHRVGLSEFVNTRINFDNITKNSTISIHEITPPEQFVLWNYVMFNTKISMPHKNKKKKRL